MSTTLKRKRAVDWDDGRSPSNHSTPPLEDTLRHSATKLLASSNNRLSSHLAPGHEINSHDDPISIPGTRASSPTASQEPLPRPLRVSRYFEDDASIVLIGIHGTGKSTLGVIAATALRRRLVDADQSFARSTGLSRAAYKKEHGAHECRARELQVLRTILLENERNCVIACGPGCIEVDGRALLKQYALTHPVIHVVRDADSIQAYTRVDELRKIRGLLTVCEPMYRSCSGFEYYNISESNTATSLLNSTSAESSSQGSPATRFLALKHVEQDFLKFVRFIIGQGNDEYEYDILHPPKAMLKEQQVQSYALAVPLSKLIDGTLGAEQLDHGVDAIEVIVDKHNVPNDKLHDSSFESTVSKYFGLIRRKTSVPILFSVVRNSSTGRGNTDSEQAQKIHYFDLLHQGLRLGADALVVDIDEDMEELQTLVRQRGSTKIMGSCYFPSPGGWKSIESFEKYNKARALGCNVIRLVQKGANMKDNMDVWDFRTQILNDDDERRPPIIAFNTGFSGRLSCCFNPILTTILPPAISDHVPDSYRTVITSQEAQKALYSSYFFEPMHFYIYGATVTFSLSPAMHEAAFRALGMPHSFRIQQSPSLRDLQVLSADPNFGGSAIALPYKTEVIPLLHSLSPHAMAIGAVNTIIPIRSFSNGELPDVFDYRIQRNRSGLVKALYGENTDWIGMRTVINRGLSPANAITPTTTGLIMGAGGMARAAVYALKQLGVRNVFVYNRTFSNAEKLASHYNNQIDRTQTDRGLTQSLGIPYSHFPPSAGKITVTPLRSTDDPWPPGFRNPTIIVSCVPAHIAGGKPAANLTIPPQWLKSPTGGVVVELAYKPLVTPLLEQIRKEAHRGWVTMDGLDVLPEQGFAQFEIFTGRRAPRQLMREEVLRNYSGDRSVR